MTIDDYKALLAVQEEAAKAEARAEKARGPWRAAALEIACERTNVPVSEVVFKPDRVEYVCHGTGMYASESWIESYPVALLFQRLGIPM